MKNTATKTNHLSHPNVPEAFVDPYDSSGNPVTMAPPDATSRILNSLGYPVNAKLLRRWAKEAAFPSVWTGKRLLIKINAVIKFLEEGTGMHNENGDIL